MNDAPQTTSIERVAASVSEVKTLDPEMGAYGFGNLGDLVKFSDLMARADVMIPPFLRMKPALCLAVTMRAQHWKMDPFALAMEAYQAKDGGPVGYQAKVFVAALSQCAGVHLNYRYEGELKIADKPVLSNNGKEIAKRTASGSIKCIAYVTIGGELFEYESPTLDEITIKNSPGWHNTPRDQLAYFAGRGWARRFRPGVILGAYDVDEVDSMRPLRDVTPQADRAPLSQRIKAATAPQTVEVAQTPMEAPEGPHWTESVAYDEAFPGSDVWDEGVRAFQAGLPVTDCPHESDRDRATDWIGGYMGAKGAAE